MECYAGVMPTAETTDNNGWKITMTWEALQGGPGSLSIEPADPADPPEGGITQTLLRSLDIAGTLANLRGTLPLTDPAVRAAHNAKLNAKLREVASEGLTDRYLALFAWHYSGRVESGETGVPAKLAEVIGKSAPTTKAHVGHARRRGLLTGSSTRPGGKLTDKALRVLEESGLLPTLAEDPYGSVS